jgi:hypothetical protein
MDACGAAGSSGLLRGCRMSRGRLLGSAAGTQLAIKTHIQLATNNPIMLTLDCCHTKTQF